MTTLVEVLIGVLLLFAGKRLFWLLVGGVGFILGITFATSYLPEASALVQLIIALLAGVIGAALALALPRIALSIAGFLAGAYLLMNLVQVFGDSALIKLGGFIIGGILGAALVGLLFDLALILLSAGLGANLLLNAVQLPRGQEALLFIVLFAIGAALQASLFKGERRQRSHA
jgi:hypothetical protein